MRCAVKLIRRQRFRHCWFKKERLTTHSSRSVAVHGDKVCLAEKDDNGTDTSTRVKVLGVAAAAASAAASIKFPPFHNFILA